MSIKYFFMRIIKYCRSNTFLHRFPIFIFHNARHFLRILFSHLLRGIYINTWLYFKKFYKHFHYLNKFIIIATSDWNSCLSLKNIKSFLPEFHNLLLRYLLIIFEFMNELNKIHKYYSIKKTNYILNGS